MPSAAAATSVGIQIFFDPSKKGLMTVTFEHSSVRDADDEDGPLAVPDSAISVAGESIAATSDKGGGRGRGSARASKNPTYWIAKLKFEHAPQGTTGKRDVHQASECATRYETKFPEDQTTHALRKHVARIGVFSKVSPKEVGTTSWPDIRDAFSEMVLIDVAPPGRVLIALVEKRANELVSASTSSMLIRESDVEELVSCVLPWPLPSRPASGDGPPVFDVLKPQVHPISSIVPGAGQSHIMSTFLIERFLCQIIKNTNEANVNSTTGACRKLNELLDLPGEVDTTHEVMGVCDSIYISIRGFTAVIQGNITIATKFDHLSDVESLHKASGKTVGTSVLQEVGASICRNEFLGSKMSTLMKGLDVIRKRGPQMQHHLKRLVDISTSSSFKDMIHVIDEGLAYFRQCSGLFSPGMCSVLEDYIHRKTDLLYQKLAKTSTEDGEKTDEFNATVATAQVLFQGCWQKFSDKTQYDMFIEGCGGMLSNMANATFTTGIVSKFQAINQDVSSSASLLKELAAALREKGGLLSPEDFVKDAEGLLKDIVAGVFASLWAGDHSLDGVYAKTDLCDSLASILDYVVCIASSEKKAAFKAASKTLSSLATVLKATEPDPSDNKKINGLKDISAHDALSLTRTVKELNGSIKNCSAAFPGSKDGSQNMWILVSTGLAEAGQHYRVQIKQESASMIAEMIDVAACKVEGSDGAWSANLPDVADGWEAFVSRAEPSLMKCDSKTLAALISEAQAAREKCDELGNSFGIAEGEGTAWTEVNDSLKVARVTLSAHNLMKSYLATGLDKPALRMATRSEIEGHAKYGIAKGDLPPMLVVPSGMRSQRRICSSGGGHGQPVQCAGVRGPVNYAHYGPVATPTEDVQADFVWRDVPRPGEALQVGVFASMQFGLEAGGGGYMGMQVASSGASDIFGLEVDGQNTETAIFSYWDLDPSNKVSFLGPQCSRFGGEGTGSHCKIPYRFSEGGKYTISVRVYGYDQRYAALVGDIVDAATGESTAIGTLLVPHAKGLQGFGRFKEAGGSFLEYFSGSGCDNQARSSVGIVGPFFGERSQVPSTAAAAYGKGCRWSDTSACIEGEGCGAPPAFGPSSSPRAAPRAAPRRTARSSGRPPPQRRSPRPRLPRQPLPRRPPRPRQSPPPRCPRRRAPPPRPRARRGRRAGRPTTGRPSWGPCCRWTGASRKAAAIALQKPPRPVQRQRRCTRARGSLRSSRRGTSSRSERRAERPPPAVLLAEGSFSMVPGQTGSDDSISFAVVDSCEASTLSPGARSWLLGCAVPCPPCQASISGAGLGSAASDFCSQPAAPIDPLSFDPPTAAVGPQLQENSRVLLCRL
ncbi:unnamed protein product [Prorocentrum cordatum]|uniref:PKD/REJ-like domain-containing protein n=1 Tax=Prorocentrum cordatum TaxID=2364126 RepID=A0ABN9T4U9_9DINO|nr:unnamed protein product [Polarella glacialis]